MFYHLKDQATEKKNRDDHMDEESEDLQIFPNEYLTASQGQ